MMAAWNLMSVLTLDGKSTYQLDGFATKEECIELAKVKWQQYWALPNDPAYKKKLATRAISQMNKVRVNIKCDYAGVCTLS